MVNIICLGVFVIVEVSCSVIEYNDVKMILYILYDFMK